MWLVNSDLVSGKFISVLNLKSGSQTRQCVCKSDPKTKETLTTLEIG